MRAIIFTGLSIIYGFVFLFVKGCSKKSDEQQKIEDEEQLRWIQEWRKQKGK